MGPCSTTARATTHRMMGPAPGARKRHLAASSARTQTDVRQLVPSQLRGRQPLQQHSTALRAAAEPAESLEALIADVLNANKAQVQRPSDLLALLDASGAGISTTVRRSWSTNGVTLSLAGSWADGAPEARKMAMLAVYQERVVQRAALLLHLLRWLARAQPQLLDAGVLQQVEAAAAANALNPAVEVLQVPQLTLMAAGLFPWRVLQCAVEQSVAAAQQALLQKPPYTYSSAKRQAAEQALRWVDASLCRGAALARLRALLLQQGKLQHWQQAAARAAAAGTAASDNGVALPNTGGRLLTAEQMFHEAWQQQQVQQQQQQQQVQQQQMFAPTGKVLLASFHSRSSSSTTTTTTVAPLLRVSCGVASAADAAVGEGAGAEQLLVCRAVSRLSGVIRQLKQQMGATDSAVGVLPQVQRFHRAQLLDLLVSWADGSPALKPPQLPDTAAANVAISSIEHDRLLRRISLEASGAELALLRRLARDKGPTLLAHFSPSVGHPFGDTPEWDYFRECPGVFTRFVVDPPSDSVKLALTPAGGATQQQQQQQQQLELTQTELQQLMQQLLLALSGSSSADAPAAAAGAAGASAGRHIQLQPAVASPGVAPAAAPAAAGSTTMELLVDGAPALRLAAFHVTSLVTVMEDLATQLPRQYRLEQPAVVVVPTPGPQRLLRDGLSAVAQATKAAAAAALLALPLLAIARPFKALQLVPAAPSTTTDANAVSSNSSSASSSSASRQRLQPVNDQLAPAELQQLCDAVQQRVAGQVWLPDGPASSSSGSSSSSPSSSSSSSPSSNSIPELSFQVVVDRRGAVLGLQPASPGAAGVMLELPLAVALRGQPLSQAQARRLDAITSRHADAPKPAKRPPRPSAAHMGYRPVAYQPLPGDGPVVLKLLLSPARDDGAGETALAGQQHVQPAVRVVGVGKAATRMRLMVPAVRGWSDADSLAAWAARGAEVSPEQQEQQEQLAQKQAAHGGLSVSVDGQQLANLEELVQQLLAANAAAEPAAAPPAPAAGKQRPSK